MNSLENIFFSPAYNVAICALTVSLKMLRIQASDAQVAHHNTSEVTILLASLTVSIFG